MDITPVVHKNINLINSYEAGEFVVNDQKYLGHIIVFPQKVILFNNMDINCTEHFELFLTQEVEVLLIGTGKVRNTLNSSVLLYLEEQKGLNFELMSTDAACRTYNVLVSEDRFVITYLLAC